jgi:hypothetical protein
MGESAELSFTIRSVGSAAAGVACSAASALQQSSRARWGASAKTASCSRRFGRVSPGTRAIRKPRPSPSAGSSTASTCGTGTPTARTALSTSASCSGPIDASSGSPGTRMPPPLPALRRRISGTVPDGVCASSDQVSLLAPPDKRSRPASAVASGTARRTSASSRISAIASL